MISEIFGKVRSNKPLVHHITNWVTIYDCANMTRAFGALPVMAHAKEESADMAAIASSLVLNIGTLTPELIDSMIAAGKSANKKNIPVVLDAVGVGATKLRDNEALRILKEIKVDIIKGNASEIAKLAGMNVTTRGVESTEVEANLADLAKDFANKANSTVVITGKQDIISDGKKVYLVNNGHQMMGSIVGTGCMAASIIGAFAGVEKDYAKASAYALASFGIAGELAAQNSKGPGTFKENLYDEAFNLDAKKLTQMAKIEEH
ncbi:hydroxyethylthiazole kinase [Candidatus Woesearchaeota archaeon]|nr:hydroxyethylthiazole kinase [Candidatus Woesearchaeota archaeon]